MTAPLPELPLPPQPDCYVTAIADEAIVWLRDQDDVDIGMNTQGAMHSYGLQCYAVGVQAERERCAKLCEAWISLEYDPERGHEETGARECAAAIRRGERENSPAEAGE